MSDKNDTPIGKMVGDTLRKKIDGKLPAKRNDKPQPKQKDTIHTGKRG